jgi:hypothetical protein
VGDHPRLLTLFAKAVELLGDDLERERRGRVLYPTVLARDELATAHAELGQFDVAVALHLGLGTLKRRRDKREQARDHLISATTMYGEMDMRFSLEQAQAELRELA